MPDSHVAVVTKNLKAFWKPVLNNPVCQITLIPISIVKPRHVIDS